VAIAESRAQWMPRDGRCGHAWHFDRSLSGTIFSSAIPGMEIVNRESLIVVGLPVRAHWKELFVKVPLAWQELFGRHTEIEYRTESAFVDASLHVSDGEYLQLVGAEVSRVATVPYEMWAVEVSGGLFLHHRHEGPVTDIAGSFGDMYRWAREKGAAAGEFKVDIGYTIDGRERSHDLFVALGDAGRWRRVEAGAMSTS
jgi:predicted transcriptional regulator YdeE